jgi:uncharacterized paraquat-inducible protein A
MQSALAMCPVCSVLIQVAETMMCNRIIVAVRHSVNDSIQQLTALLVSAMIRLCLSVSMQ